MFVQHNNGITKLTESKIMQTAATTEFESINMTDKASVTTYIAGAATGLWGMLTFEHIVALLGIFIGLTGLAVNTYYKHKQDKREHERHLKYMQGLEKKE